MVRQEFEKVRRGPIPAKEARDRFYFFTIGAGSRVMEKFIADMHARLCEYEERTGRSPVRILVTKRALAALSNRNFEIEEFCRRARESRAGREKVTGLCMKEVPLLKFFRGIPLEVKGRNESS